MIVTIGFITAGAVAVNAFAIALGRFAHTAAARTAFASGLAALCAFPLTFLAAITSFVPAPLDAPTPILPIIGSIVLVGATLCSLITLVPLMRNPRRGA